MSYHSQIENGDACVAGKETKGQHANLSAPKARWWFAVGGAKVRVKNVKACEGK
jgi:hypothetical protein